MLLQPCLSCLVLPCSARPCLPCLSCLSPNVLLVPAFPARPRMSCFFLNFPPSFSIFPTPSRFIHLSSSILPPPALLHPSCPIPLPSLLPDLSSIPPSPSLLLSSCPIPPALRTPVGWGQQPNSPTRSRSPPWPGVTHHILWAGPLGRDLDPLDPHALGTVVFRLEDVGAAQLHRVTLGQVQNLPALAVDPYGQEESWGEKGTVAPGGQRLGTALLHPTAPHGTPRHPTAPHGTPWHPTAPNPWGHGPICWDFNTHGGWVSRWD